MAKLKISIKDLNEPKLNSGKTFIANIIAEALNKAGFEIDMRGSIVESNGITGDVVFGKDYMIIESGIDGVDKFMMEKKTKEKRAKTTSRRIKR